MIVRALHRIYNIERVRVSVNGIQCLNKIVSTLLIEKVSLFAK